MYIENLFLFGAGLTVFPTPYIYIVIAYIHGTNAFSGFFEKSIKFLAVKKYDGDFKRAL